MTKTYLFTDHLHRFAVWTAARAAQRNFTSTEKIGQAIKYAGLEQKVAVLAKMDQISTDQYDDFHREVAGKLMESLRPHAHNTTYGRVAKIIAIYIKTTQVIRSPESALSRVAHPPIDRILLQNLAADKTLQLQHFKKINWTELTEDDYFDLITKLRPLCKDFPFWKLEEYWLV